MEKTRREHLDWCIERAIAEMDFYKDPSKAFVSMASDLRKHPETNSQALITMCIMQPMMKPNQTRQEVITFLNGFN